MRDTIEIIGATANNLRNVDVSFPLGKVTMLRGVSGSGKSSLLADTLAAEAERRTSLFLGLSRHDREAHDVEAFVGRVPATIHVTQRGFRASVRTTIATSTGLLSTLRRLYLECGRPYSRESRRDVSAPTARSYADWLSRWYSGTLEIAAVPVFYLATDGVVAVKRLRTAGIETIVVRSETDPPKIFEQGRKLYLDKFRPLPRDVKHVIEATIGKVKLGPRSDPKELRDLLERAFRAGNGNVIISLPHTTDPYLSGPFGPRLDSRVHWVDPDTQFVFSPPSRHLLSFNAPEHAESGACRTCRGIGRSFGLRLDELVAHPNRSMHAGAFSIWTKKNYRYVNIQHETIEGLRGIRGFDPDKPWNKLSEDAKNLVLDGAGSLEIADRDVKTGKPTGFAPRKFPGFRAQLMRRAVSKQGAELLGRFVSDGSCSDCGGTRWLAQVRALRVGDFHIHELLALPFDELASLTESRGFANALPREARHFAVELHHQATSFASVGLAHLNGERAMTDISEGESRRSRLAGVLNARVAGLCLLLDEPARGLHEQDVASLAAAIRETATRHTVVLNEHRTALLPAVDQVIELGPGAGPEGGELERVTSGSSYRAQPAGLDRKRLPVPSKHPFIEIRGATIHNVRDVDCAIPIGRLVCITGVSGSGKSNFVRGVLVPALSRALKGDKSKIAEFSTRAGSWTKVSGLNRVSGLVALDQTSPNPNRRSLVATFLDLAGALRAAFAKTPEARRARLTESDFGINSGMGRCEVCLGIGEVEDRGTSSACSLCGGARYGRDVLAVRIGGLNMSDLLDKSISDLLGDDLSQLRSKRDLLQTIKSLGIGYISLGRRVDSLSGGEIQRLRIARSLCSQDKRSGQVYVLDEPAAGLHERDVAQLLTALNRIVDQGRNTVVLVEHNLDIIRASDWIVDFGPGTGNHGGRIVAEGPPDKVRKSNTPTGLALAGKLGRSKTKSPRRTAKLSKPSAASFQRAQSFLRKLVGDDVETPGDVENVSTIDQPGVVLDQSFWGDRWPFEIGGLDLEIAKVLLEANKLEPASDQIERLVGIWNKASDSWLAVHPCVADLQTWGAALPRTVMKTSSVRLAAQGLHLVDLSGRTITNEGDWRRLRATGERFRYSKCEPFRVMYDAVAMGGGYVELRDRNRVIGTIQTRRLDLDRGLVGPMRPTPSHFSRHVRFGWCPGCRGRAELRALPDSVVIRSTAKSPSADGFLHAEAAKILKGVRATEQIPFFNRLAEEGLWEVRKPYAQLEPSERSIVLFGFWQRPGHGSFLKRGKDPSEVGSWLKWDGLYASIFDQLSRSTSDDWRQKVETSGKLVRCPFCSGTGLAPGAQLLTLARRRWPDWVVLGSAGELLSALRDVPTGGKRQKRSVARIIECLADASAHARLNQTCDRAHGMAVATKVVGVFSHMHPVLA